MRYKKSKYIYMNIIIIMLSFISMKNTFKYLDMIIDEYRNMIINSI